MCGGTGWDQTSYSLEYCLSCYTGRSKMRTDRLLRVVWILMSIQKPARIP